MRRWLLFSALLTVACRSADLGDDDFPDLVDRTVYQTVLESLYVRPVTSSGASQLLLVDSTDPYPLGRIPARITEELLRLPGVDTATLRSFERRNQEPHSLAALRRFSLRMPLTVISRNTLPYPEHIEASTDSFWPTFRTRFPGASGFISMSSIGYNPARDRALVAVTHSPVGGPFTVTYVVLQAHGRGWRISATEVVWTTPR